MLTNKIIAERINVLLNLLFHLEDYINNQQQREEQIHISDLVKSVLTEVTSSEVIKNYFFKGADAKNEINEEKDEIKSEFKLNKLTEQKINYIKKINPQSFNQKNLDVLNFFYNSSGEADMIYDLVKFKIFSIIKFCLTHIMLKKYKEDEKKIFNKINFALINKNSYYKKVESNWKNKDKNIYRSKSSIRNKFISSPNFIIPPSSLPEGLGPNPKKKIFPKIENNSNYKSNMYKKIGFAKNYKLIQTNSEEKYEEINNNKSPGFNKLKQNKITSETKLDLINILHKMRKKPIFSDNKNKPKNNLIKSYEKIPEIKIPKKKENKIDNKKIYLKKDKKDAPFTKEFDYNTVFNMFDALKKRGYLY
jgi:hypothetical protein